MTEGYLPTIYSMLEVAGAAHIEDIVEFDGPRVSNMFGAPYETFYHAGVKEEGEAFVQEPCFLEAEAWYRFNLALIERLRGVKQLAWRRRPSMDGKAENGTLVVSCRLVTF